MFPGGLLTADLHAGPVPTGAMLTPTCFSGTVRRGAPDRVLALRCLWYLTTSLHRVVTMAPGFLGTWAAWHFISRSCPLVVRPGQEVSNKEVIRRAVACTGRCGVWAASALASGCSCEVMGGRRWVFCQEPCFRGPTHFILVTVTCRAGAAPPRHLNVILLR